MLLVHTQKLKKHASKASPRCSWAWVYLGAVKRLCTLPVDSSTICGMTGLWWSLILQMLSIAYIAVQSWMPLLPWPHICTDIASQPTWHPACLFLGLLKSLLKREFNKETPLALSCFARVCSQFSNKNYCPTPYWVHERLDVWWSCTHGRTGGRWHSDTSWASSRYKRDIPLANSSHLLCRMLSMALPDKRGAPRREASDLYRRMNPWNAPWLAASEPSIISHFDGFNFRPNAWNWIHLCLELQWATLP